MSCRCRDATLRAYKELTEAGQREDRAYDSAVRVFRHYHPESSRVEAYQVVADWLEWHEAGADPAVDPLEKAEA